MNQSDSRWQQITHIWHSYQWLYTLAGVLIGILVYPLFQLLNTDLGSLLQDLIPEALGIIFTVLFIDAIYHRREIKREKERLIREMNNRDSGLVMRAVEELRANGWLEDGSLFDARMGDANLRGVNLKRADFTGTRFLTDKQLAQSQRLWKAIMPDGKRYDGRFNLEADIARAKENGIDISDPEAMAKDYEVNLEDYLAGQQWASENYEWLSEVRIPLNS